MLFSSSFSSDFCVLSCEIKSGLRFVGVNLIHPLTRGEVGCERGRMRMRQVKRRKEGVDLGIKVVIEILCWKRSELLIRRADDR